MSIPNSTVSEESPLFIPPCLRGTLISMTYRAQVVICFFLLQPVHLYAYFLVEVWWVEEVHIYATKKFEE